MCKKAALTQKTTTGIKRFQEDQGFGKWFTALFEVVKTRESCQSDLALEPLASPSPSELSVQSCVVFHRKRTICSCEIKKRRQSSKEKMDMATTQALTLVKVAVRNDPTKELISFMREKMEKSRQHELQLIQLFHGQKNEASFHSTPYSSHEHTHTLQILAITEASIVVHRQPQVTQDQACENGHWGPPTITQWDLIKVPLVHLNILNCNNQNSFCV